MEQADIGKNFQNKYTLISLLRSRFLGCHATPSLKETAVHL